tara:strand:- start:2444 stop:2572 length:129 start_codon:yes stop_codon:yes gene_type:complete
MGNASSGRLPEMLVKPEIKECGFAVLDVASVPSAWIGQQQIN